MGVLGTSCVIENECTVTAQKEQCITLSGRIKKISANMVIVQITDTEKYKLLSGAEKYIITSKDVDNRAFSASTQSVAFAANMPGVIGFTSEIRVALENSREYPRYPYVVDSAWRFTAAGQWVACKTINVSIGGAALELRAKPIVGQTIMIDMYDKYNNKNFELRAEVRHVHQLENKHYFVGCMSDETKDLCNLINAVCDYQLSAAMTAS